MNTTGIAHIVQTVRDIDRTGEFCVSVFEITAKNLGVDKMALKFGAQKINLHMKLKRLMNFKSILKLTKHW